ncbi:MAG TPA: hypothetical protein VKI45_01405 [Allosphingosinicella sp.]|nr:hypothetical protein [Allosphingosinicella sp.]
MGDQAVKPSDPAESAMGDAGKGSFQQSQNAGQKGEEAGRGGPAEGRDEEWHDKLKDQISGKEAPREGREDAAGPGRGRS